MTGLIHVYKGDGKGKTTATAGLAVRAAGQDMKVIYLQFLKGGISGEINIMKNLENITVIRNTKNFDFFMNLSEDEKAGLIAMQNDNLEYAIKLAKSGEYQMLVIDELFSAYNLNTIDREKIKRFLSEKPEKLEVVLSGHDPEDFFIEIADYVTNMEKIKHPYDKGVTARLGIEI